VADALGSWKGSIIFVSHDPEFVEQLQPDKVLLMPDGDVDYFSGDWLELVSLA
jgi:ATPase subunit of ABC transporter with duplicated ATPase domains